MIATIRISLACLFSCSILTLSGWAQTNTQEEMLAAWKKLSQQPVTEKNFRSACDLMQQIGRTNLKQSYAMLAEYTPKVKATGNRHWVHILLMGWARAKESTGYFDEAEKLYAEVLKNTQPEERYYREAMVFIVLMYGEWGKIDSLDKYVEVGERLCKAAEDKENLSFLYGFKAMTRMADTASMRHYFEQAMRLAADLPDKNALFTATYNYAYMYCQSNLYKQVTVFESLLELSGDSTLTHYPPKLYERTAFTFRNAGPSVYYNLMQINLLLTDYDNAWKFAELFYDATIKPNPASINAPYFNAEMAMAKAHQGGFEKAKEFLDKSRQQFNMAEDSIPYNSYFIAAGMLAEQAGHDNQALHYYAQALKKGNTQSQHLIPPEIYYAHALIRTGQLKEAEQVLSGFKQAKDARKYSAIGLNYHKYYAELLKAKGDYPAYSEALQTYYTIKDSLTNLNRYRAIKEVEAKVRIRDKEQQITRLNEESTERTKQLRRERIFYVIIISFTVLMIGLLVLLLRNRQIRSRQQEALQQSNIEQLQKQHRIEVMQQAMDAEERERRKIADQLHDEVNATLALASLNISSVMEKGTQDEQSDKRLLKSYESIVSVATTIRDLSHRLTPLVIEKYGFRKAIEELSDTVNLSGKIKFETVVVGFDDTRKYNSAFLNDLYRIIQELLHNIIKHAKANQASLEMVEHENHISIMVEDNGIGIAEDMAGKGKGLTTIQSRIAYLNGKMEIARKQENGTLIVMEIPV
ncbi:MAG: tetratricopeptide repeat protein [Niastella sp.]|nr:tetratricopeptide repeat protein [Niastella sp.]